MTTINGVDVREYHRRVAELRAEIADRRAERDRRRQCAECDAPIAYYKRGGNLAVCSVDSDHAANHYGDTP